jgi:hypothetical protein
MQSKSIISSSFVFATLFVLLGATSSFTAQGGRLMVNRVASFGEAIPFTISVDGKQVARLDEGRSYDGLLTPGRHVISVAIAANLFDSALWQKEINVQSGQTYSFTAVWPGERMRAKAAPKLSETIPKNLRDLGLESALRNEREESKVAMKTL